MPLKLCNSEQKRLDELLDRVEEFSNIVDDLSAEVNAIKLHLIDASNKNLTESRDQSEVGTLQKLKKCLKKSLSPVFSMGRSCRVWKKFQQIFSQCPTIIPRPVNLPDNECTVHHNISSSSHAEANTCSLTSETSPPPRLDKTEAKGQERQIQLPSQHHKKITKDSQKAESLENSSSSSKRSENSFKKSYQPHNPHCRYETSNIWTLSQFDDSGQLEKKITKKKTTGTDAEAPASPIRVASHKQRNVNSQTVKQQQTVSFKEGERKTLEKSSYISTVLPGTNIYGHHLQDWSGTSTNPKSDFNVERTIKATPIEPEKKKKRSMSVQCSIDCEYLNTLPSRTQKDVCIGTLFQYRRRKNKNEKIKNLKKVRKKLTNQETQTSLKMNKLSESIDLLRRNCLEAKGNCFSAGSQSSLTCSANSTSSFYLRTEDLGEDSTHMYCERGPMSVAEHFEKRRNAKTLKGRHNARTRHKRRKRTYMRPPDTPIRKSDETVESNFCDQEENSSIGDTAFQGKILKQRKRRKKLKKPEVSPKCGGDHHFWNKQQSLLKRDSNYMLTSVCTNRRTQWLIPKLERHSNWMLLKKQKVPCKLAKFHESTSFSSLACNNETCLLASDPSLSRSDGSITSNTFDREERVQTKNFATFSRQ